MAAFKHLMLLCVFMLPFLFSGKVQATHFVGGELTYTHVVGNTYRLQVAFYRDCIGVPAPTTVNVRITPAASGVTNVSLTRTSLTDISPLCPGQVSTCAGGTTFGVEEDILSANVTLPPLPPGARYDLSYASCCRNGVITTIQNPLNTGWTSRASVPTGSKPGNSSPQFLNKPINIVCINNQVTISPNAFDPDGDALRYSLTACEGNSTFQPLTYVAPRSATDPLSTSSGFTLNPNTGDLTFTPNAIQVGVICLLVEEIDANNQVISAVTRDVQVSVVNCNNANPVVSVPGNQVVPVGTTQCFNITITDADNDNLLASATSALINLGVGSFTILSNNPGVVTAQFCVTPTAAQQGNTFGVSISAQDNACPAIGNGANSFNIIVPIVCNATVTAQVTDESCPGLSNGGIDLTATGVTAPVQYSWTGPGGFSAFTEDLTGLAAGTYNVVVSDVNGCTAQGSFTVGVAGSAPSVTTSTSNPSCNGFTDGSITVTVSGGTAPFTYSKDNGATSQASNVFTGLGAGTFIVSATDANGCTSNLSIEMLMEPSAVSGNFSNIVNVSCPGGNDGSLTIAGSGGSAPYSYSWSNGATTATISNLMAGSYTVTITDANGCTATETTQIATDPDLTAPVITCGADVTVDAGCGGQFATVTYATPTATDNCDSNPAVALLSGPASGTTVPLGTFRVVYSATDAAGNVDTCGFNVTVTALSLPPVTAGPDTAVCAGETVTLCASTPGSAGVAGGLFISEYVEGSSFNKYIELYNGTSSSINLSNYSLRLYSNGNSNPNNNNQLSGTIASGGTVVLRNSSAAIFNGPSLVVPAVNFNGDDAVVLWDNVNNRAVDIFGVIGNDPGSQWSLSGNNTQNQTLRRNFNVTMGIMTNPSGTGPTGFATLGSEWTEFAQNDASGLGSHSSAAPGSAGGSFVWSNGATTQCITVTPGSTTTYSVTFTDANNCSNTASATVTINPNPVVAFSVQDEGCFAAGDGSVSAVVSSGTAPFSYNWSNGSTMQTISNLSAGTYSVTITDANGCTTSGSATVSGGTSPVVNGGADQVICLGDSVTLCAGGAGGVFISEYVEGSSFNKYIEIYNGTGSMVDLSTYQLRVYFNGSGSPQSTMLSGMLPSGGTAVFGNGSATVFTGNYTVISNANWNGNDLIALFNTNTNQFEDVFGVFGQNPGSNGWSAGSISGTANTTLRRVSTVTQGVTNTGTTFPTLGTEWTAFATNDVSGLGAHSSIVPANVAWSTGATTSCITVSPSMTTAYFVTNTDGNGCVAIDTVLVTVNIPPVVSVSTVDETCTRDGDGSATASATGNGPFTFAWSNGGATATINNLAPGMYTVTVTDANGCSTSSSGVVNTIPDVTAPVITCPADVVVDAGCGGQFAVVTYAAPTATDNCTSIPNVVLVSGPASGTTVPLGTFPVTYQATDSSGNTATCSFNVTVTGKPLPTVSAGADVAVCDGESVQLCATVNNVSSGGLFISEYVEGSSFNKYIEIYNGGSTTINLANYSLRLYSNGAVTPNNNNSLAAGGSLAPGQTVVFKNSSAVAFTGTAFTLSAINFNGDDAVELYDNVNNRTIDIFGVIGQDPGSQWSFGGNNTQNRTLRRNASVTTGISVNPATFATLATEWTEFAQNDVSGLGSHNSVVPGNLSGTYTWTTGSNSSCITVTPGMTTTYAVTFTDTNGCASTDSVTVTVNPNPSVSLNGVDEGCFAAGDGSVAATVTGGTSPFTYNWTNGGSSATITNLSAGGYGVTVTDANGCIDNGSTTIAGGTSPSVDAGMDQAICLGDTATFSVDTRGGIFFSEYAEGSAFNKYLEVYNGTNDTLNLANFSVRTYFNGATSPQVTNNLAAGGLLPPGGTIVLQNSSAANFQGNALSIGAVNFNGDDAVVLWNDVLNAPMDIFGVIGNDPGSQWDGTGGQETNEQTLRRVSSVRTGIKVNPSGTGNTAFTTLSTEWEVFPRDDVSGLGFHNSVAPGSTVWSNGSMDQSITVSPSATTSYTVTYTDGNGCSATDTVTLTVNNPPVVATSVTNVTCNGFADGTATATATGVAPYTFAWSNGQTTMTATGLAPGSYTVTVTDANGCSSTGSATITEPTALVAAATATDASCNGFADGTATATATGGTAPYAFAWSTGATTANIGGLNAGTYTVTITDANGCTATASATVAEPAVLVANIASFANVKCNGENSGRATVAATGGTAPYSFAWSNGTTTATDTTLAAGTYTITVTDANFCTAATSITITEPTALVLNLTSTPSKCDLNDGTATVVATGGTVTFFRGYAFQWSTGSIGTTVTGLAPGTYTVTVTDANDCQATGSVTVGEVPPPSISLVAPADTACKGERVRLEVVSTDSNAANYVYSWSSNPNRNRDFINALVNNRNTTFAVTVTDPATGCSSSDTVSFTVDNLAGRISCCEDQAITCGMSATIPVEITQGTGPYTVTFTDGTNMYTQTSATSPVNLTVSPGATTVYDLVALTNSRGCTGKFCGKFTVAVNCDTVVASPCPIKLDFAADSAGNALAAGTVVTNQWADRGINISVRNNHNSHPDKALIFDSGNPTGTDDDLGTPNQAFNGPGIGNGGGMGMAGQNDKFLGNLLIIAENDRDNDNNGLVDDPDDEARGGDIIFDFDTPTTIEYVTLVDLDEVHGAVMVCEQPGGGTTTIPFPNLGDNAVATVPVNVRGVTSFKVKFAGSGGIAELGYCPDCNDVIDFNDLTAGETVNNQYAGMGVRFSFSNNNVNNPDKGIVFNSSAPTGNDPDLGTPNRDFNNGPGIGNGGRRGRAGENSEALGNLLIIAENDVDANNNGLVDDPDDEQDGGEMTIEFDNATTVSALTLVDLDDRNSQIVVEKSGGVSTTIPVPYLGDNAVKEIAINEDDVEFVRLQLGGSGALAELRFCQPACEEPGIYAGVLTSGNNSGCRTTVLEIAATAANKSLDYIDISIPCGTVQNLSNSLHLPMTVISNDPQSGITGIRISNIPAADSAGTLFTVTYTNCKTCRNIQRCNPLMAFGRGSCIYYREADGIPTSKSVPAAAASNENDEPVQGGVEAISQATAFPNPFNESTTISFTLSSDDKATVEIFSMTGVKVATLFEGDVEGGREYRLDFRPNALSDGIYLYRVSTESGAIFNDKLILRR